MLCFFIYLDILSLIICFLLLNKVNVNVFVNLVLLILVGFVNRKFVSGLLGLLMFVFVFKIVLDIKLIVLF